MGLDERRVLRAWLSRGVRRLRWLDRPVVRWGLLVAGWTLWVRLFFHGPLQIGGWSVPDRPWTLVSLGLAVGLLLARNTGWIQAWNPRGWVRPVGIIVLLGLAVGGWVGLTRMAWRDAPPRGFTAFYFRDLEAVGTPWLRVHDRTTQVRSWLFPPDQPWAVEWVGFFHISRPGPYHLSVYADDAAWVWIDRQMVVRPTGGRTGETSKALVPLTGGWHGIRLRLQNRSGPYEFVWYLCPPDRPGRTACLRPSDFWTAVPARSHLQRLRVWKTVWWGWTLVLLGALAWRGFRAGRRPEKRQAFVHGLWVLGVLGVGWWLRSAMHPVVPAMVTSDEAVFYDMAMDIVEGRGYMSWAADPPTYQRPGRPTFVYGQAYLGSHVSILTALWTWLTGRSYLTLVWALDFAALAYCLGVYALGTALWDRRVGLGALAMAVVCDFFQYGWERMGGRAVVLALTAWTLWALTRMSTADPADRTRWRYDFWVGFLMGLTLWAHFLTVSVGLVVAAYVLLFAVRYRREAGWASLLYAALGSLLGLMPVIVWNAYHGWISLVLAQMNLQEMGRGGVPVEGTGGWASLWVRIPRNFQALVSILARELLGAVCPGQEPFWTFGWVLVLWGLATGWYLVRYRTAGETTDEASRVIRSIPLTLTVSVLALNLARSGPPPDARYLVPLYAILPVLMAAWLRHAVFRWSPEVAGILLVLVVAARLHSMAHGYQTAFAGARSAWDLLDFLKTRQIRSVLTDFWQAYHLMWLSDEGIRAAPYFITTKNRHALLAHQALSDPQAAVLLRSDQLEAVRLEEELARQGIQYRREEFQGWVLLYGFSRPFWSPIPTL
ncbi:hypothetical protein HRbin11_01319 [bacterium HR11]|nr:hypothetical protein HRbin11_01319 [bacterium HR11]